MEVRVIHPSNQLDSHQVPILLRIKSRPPTTITLTKSPPADDDDANSIDGRFSSFRSSELRVLSHKKSNAASIWGSFFFGEI